ncbi:hypothetical protein ARMSODRAFT_982662 [Armillaria solidipes]|uniref:Uncharacterized protein n=1 Tax=Armillaria solidipes TaxID=1076256 RepID=A0A2H3B812_9AGAR|nr:hypothetical protein ARMSODRAFT_982662 [Armillaria solidipes]
MSDPSDQCAVDANGQLKPAAKIDFYFDKDDNVPMSGPSAAGQSHGRMKKLLDAEMRDEDGQPVLPTNPCRHRKKAKKNKKKSKCSAGATNSVESDPDNGDFSTESESEDTSDADMSETDITNKELAGILTSKIVPDKIKRKSVVIEEVEDEESPTNIASTSKKARHYIIEDDSEDDDDSNPAPQASKQAGSAKWKCRVSRLLCNFNYTMGKSIHGGCF